jgi:hypothetical protein
MRTVALLLMFSACYPDRNVPEELPPDAGECRVGCTPPIEEPEPVDLGNGGRIAAGTTATFHRLVGGSSFDGVELTSSDSSILTARVISSNAYEVIAHAAGHATIEARRPGFPQVLDTIGVTAVPVEAIEVFFRAAPGANAPITRFAGIRGATDGVCVRYLAEGGEILDGRGQFAATSDALVVLAEPGSKRISESFAHRSTCVRLAFAKLGTTNLIASIEGGVSRTIAVEVITAAPGAELRFMVLRNSELVAAPDPVITGELVGVDLVGRTSDGRFVGGLVATWTLGAPADSFLVSDDELVFTVEVAGTAQITATAGPLVRTQAITAAD